MNPPVDPPAIAKASRQPKIFAAQPRRSELLALKPSWPCRATHLRVHRNMPFEFVASALPAFLAYAGLQAEVHISDYDDALNFHTEGPADCELIWLDFGRYAGRFMGDELKMWLHDRLLALRAATPAPILVANGGGAAPEFNRAIDVIAAQIPGCRVFPRQMLEDSLGAKWFDDRVKDISASTMSDAANLAVAQALGLVWVPSTVSVALKAIVLDLDNTLYAGVLGEDGADGVRLTDAHRALQQRILELKQQGLFLAILSRNEMADVEKLFATRKDFPLQSKDFSALSIGWHDKAQGLHDIATGLRIHSDAMLVLDDNLSEIGALAQQHPDTALFYAADAELATRALGMFPGLLRVHQDGTDALRADDLKAAQTRTAALASAPDPVEYMRSLAIDLEFRLNPRDLLGRLTDLANKTNQFVLALARFNEAEVARRLDNDQCASFSVALSDKLSDSGVIAAIFSRHEQGMLIVDEICISCRALGRGIEDLMIATVLDKALQKYKTNKVAFAYNRGPRNDPGRNWLGKFTGKSLDETGRIEVDWASLRAKIPALPVDLSWQEAG